MSSGVLWRRFSSRWEHTLSSGLALARVQLDVRSADTLDTNLTSALVDLARLVRTNWTADYYAPQVTLPRYTLRFIFLLTAFFRKMPSG